MKNFNLNIDKKALAAVRCYSSNQGLSVNQLVREILTHIVDYNNLAQARNRIRGLRRLAINRLRELVPDLGFETNYMAVESLLLGEEEYLSVG